MWPLFLAEYLRQNCWFWAGTVWSRCSTAPRPPCRHPRRTHQTPTPCSSTGTPQQFQIRIKFMARAGHAPHFSSLRQIQDLDTPRQCDPFPVLKVQHAAAFLTNSYKKRQKVAKSLSMLSHITYDIFYMQPNVCSDVPRICLGFYHCPRILHLRHCTLLYYTVQ